MHTSIEVFFHLVRPPILALVFAPHFESVWALATSSHVYLFFGQRIILADYRSMICILVDVNVCCVSYFFRYIFFLRDFLKFRSFHVSRSISLSIYGVYSYSLNRDQIFSRRGRSAFLDRSRIGNRVTILLNYSRITKFILSVPIQINWSRSAVKIDRKRSLDSPPRTTHRVQQRTILYP